MNNKNNTNPTHAVVIGGSVAGLLTARVLTKYFAGVTVIERDQFPDEPTFRNGAPHARHAHGLLVRGQQIMESYFPGFTEGLLTNGATLCNMGRDVAFHVGGQWMLRYDSPLDLIGCSRALLEHQLYDQLRRNPQVQFRQGYVVEALCTDQTNTKVTGVTIRKREAATTPERVAATVVVDASGRGSRLPEWLQAVGYEAPTEITIDAKAGYASRIYQAPNDDTAWRMMYYLAEAPEQSRGGILMPLEDSAEHRNRWLVTLIGLNGDHPPTDDAGFVDFARSLPSPELYQAMQAGTPLTAAYGYQRAANRLRSYDQLPRYLEGVVAVGDAVYALNPVYGQGMTVAAMGVQVLDQQLQRHQQRYGLQNLTGLARTFQCQLAKVITAPWQLATGQDLRWPVAANGHQVDLASRIMQRYVNAVIRTMANDAIVANAFSHVQNMLWSPGALFHPRITWRVWRAERREKQRREVRSRQPFMVSNAQETPVKP